MNDHQRDALLTRMNQKLDFLLMQTLGELQMTSDVQTAIQKIKDETAAQTTVIGANNTLLAGLSAQIAALRNTTTDPATAAALGDLATAIDANTASLSAAVVANTPAE